MATILRWFKPQKHAPDENRHPSRRKPTPQVKREPTFRIRGVPNDWDKDKLWSFLIERDSPAGPEVKSLAKEFHGRSQTATVSFRNTCQLPLRISLPAESGQMERPRNVTLDHDFLGITSLFIPRQQDHKVE